MRLIDADELKNTIINMCGNCSNIIREYKDGVPDGNCAIQHIMNMIDNAPTVEMALSLDNISDEDIQKFKMIWQRATSKGLLMQTVNCKDCDGYEAGYSAGLKDAMRGDKNENND